MPIWSAEIKELERLYESLKGHFPELEKELEQLIETKDANVVMLYSRRCLEVIVTDLCECELKRERGTEPLKGVIDKLNKEKKVPSNIITSMDHLNSLSAYGAHPKDFDPEQVKPVLNNLDIIIKWYLKYRGFQVVGKPMQEESKSEIQQQTISPPEKSIIVLPFENISPDPDQEYFCDGMTEEIISLLSGIKVLRVISRTSAMMFKGTRKSIKTIGQELNVRYVLEGSVRKSGKDLRITAQLIEAQSDTHLWAETFKGSLEDIFDIQEDVSRKIVFTLRLKLDSEDNENLTRRSIDNIQVYDFYLRAMEEILKCSKKSIDQALRYLQNALNIIGDNALLYSTIAFAYWQLVNIGIKQEDYLQNAEIYARKALSFNSKSSLAHTILGYIYWFQRKMPESIPRFKEALSINPNEVMALVGILSVYYNAGKISEATSFLDKLKKIDPLSLPTNWCIGAYFFYDGKFREALQGWQKLYELYPENPLGQWQYSSILVYNNKKDEAISIIEQNFIEKRETVMAKLGLILMYAMQGEKEKIFKEMTQEFKSTIVRDCAWSHNLSGYLSLANLKDEAVGWLEIASQNSFINYPLLNEKDPFLENIRGEERFKKLMERVKYEWENFEV